MTSILTSLHGRKLGLSGKGNLVGKEIDITPKCADASITVSAENTNVRTVTIQLKDINGDDIDYPEAIFAAVFADANKTAFSSGGSTGLAIGTDGALLAVVAKKLFLLTSESDGDIDLTWTDTGTDAAYLGLLLPTGRWVISDAMTNA